MACYCCWTYPGGGGVHNSLWPRGAENSLPFTCIKSECRSTPPGGGGRPGVSNYGCINPFFKCCKNDEGNSDLFFNNKPYKNEKQNSNPFFNVLRKRQTKMEFHAIKKRLALRYMHFYAILFKISQKMCLRSNFIATVVEVKEGMMKTLRISQAKHTRRNTS